MKAPFFYLFMLILFFPVGILNAQELNQAEALKKKSGLFQNNQILAIKLSYSNKEIRENTNDSAYLKTDLSYLTEEGSWKTIDVKIRARGNYRLANCYFPPIKLKFKKSSIDKTIFKGNKKLKLVLPCLNSKNLNDDLIKEFIAYKLYEIVSPYHFKTRLADNDFTEIKGKKTIHHSLKAILVEDDKNLEKRYNGEEIKRVVHPLLQDTISSVQNAFFQYMIANTDYSTAYQHNEKLFLIDGKMIPVPYDFDMSGFVNASYAVVSEIQNEQLTISRVTQRQYRGFKRSSIVFEQVRNQYIDNQDKIIDVIDSYKTLFYEPKEYEKAREFILKFYEILLNDKKFNREIVKMGRTK